MLRRSLLQAFPLLFASRSGRAAPLAQFDEAMRLVMERQRVPGGSLSIAKDGRLVYARGFGLGSVEGRVPVQPNTMFGLASVSKSITAVAALKLVDEGRLNLDDRAYDILDNIKPLPHHRVDPRTRRITVRQLLHHASGYTTQPDMQEVTREMGVPLPKLREYEVVTAFRGHPLGFDPGTKQVYSNFGFVVAGAVVERIMGMPYGPAVHRLVLRPMGIRRPYVGHGGPQRPDVAILYGPAGKHLPPMDNALAPAGGWVASTPDLIRFLVSLDRGFLSRAVMEEMLRPPEPPLTKRANGAWFGLGWDVVRQTPRAVSYSKDGGLPGVRAVMGHLPGGVDWAVAFNSGREVKGEVGIDADAMNSIREAVEATAEWPDGDLFPEMG